MLVKLVTAFLLFLAALCCASEAIAEPTVAPSERVRRNVVVRASPDGHGAPIAALNPGGTLPLDGEVPGWYRVRLPDGRIGFVSKSWTLLVPETTIAAAGAYRVHVIDVGTGLAVFIEGPDFTMLYDGGSQDDLATGADNRIIAYINAVHPGLQTLDHLVLSHPHKDHLELLPDIFDRFSVRNVWDSGRVNPTRGYCRFLRKVEAEAGVQYHNAIASGGVQEVQFSGAGCSGTIRIPRAAQMSAAPVPLGNGATMTILYRDAAPHPDPNQNTVVVRLDLGTSRLLLAGDAEAGDRELPATAPQAGSIEWQLLDCCRADLRADVLIVGHHGSLTSSRTAFLEAVGASIYVISSGPHPYSGVVLPDHDVVAELESRGQLLRTDLHDEECAADTTKVGPDADESPGGCNSVLIRLGSGAPTAAYSEPVD
jgi:beta-lactamase superfamily II metal-dependent hydrolase